MTDLTLPEYTVFSGYDDLGTEILYDDEQINRCRHDKDQPSACQTCLAHTRCDELVREEWAREWGTEPSEEVES